MASLAIRRETEAKLTTVDSFGLRRLCGETWDWIEARP